MESLSLPLPLLPADILSLGVGDAGKDCVVQCQGGPEVEGRLAELEMAETGHRA